MISLYHVYYWSSLDWRWCEYDVIAESEESIRAKVDESCPPSCRTYPYRKGEEETLKITKHEDITLPWRVPYP